MAEKSSEAFRTIREVSEEIGVRPNVLRFWESKIPAIKPVKSNNGRRYYRPGDIVMLARIKNLLYEDGYSIRGVCKVLREGGSKMKVELGPRSQLRREVHAIIEELQSMSRMLVSDK